MSLLSRKTDCEIHDWMSTVNSGLRRNLCTVCGMINIETVMVELTIPASLQRIAAAAR